ncbi:MAG: hypothetical protein ACR2PK_18975 [Acidimicrobiales bacterium]
MAHDNHIYGEFWRRRKGLRDVDLNVPSTSEDIRPGSGTAWGRLWDDCVDAGQDNMWKSFVGGDADVANRREVRWLLGA